MRSGNTSIMNGAFDSTGSAGSSWASTASSRYWSGKEMQCARPFSFTDVITNSAGVPDVRWVARPLG